MRNIHVEVAQLPNTIEEGWQAMLAAMEKSNGYVFVDEVRDTFRNLFYQGANFILAHNGSIATAEDGSIDLNAVVQKGMRMLNLDREMAAYNQASIDAVLSEMVKDGSAS